LLTTDLVRRIERLIAPDPTLPGQSPEPGAPTVAQFGRTIAAKALGGRPSNKVFCFGAEDVSRLGDILAFYATDPLEPTFYLTPVGFSDRVAALLSSVGFAQCEFRQAILYGLPSSELASPAAPITIEKVTADNLDDYVRTLADGFEWPSEWREATMAGARRGQATDGQRFLARYQGEPAAVATLRTREGVASLGGGATIPAFRGKGCHRALVRHRLDVAYLLGCTLVVGSADFGSGSFRNQQRAGLRLAYIESGWRRGRAP
jgi:GNAT superfamily N-acetyltransferase